jgi:hypothetical protein
MELSNEQITELNRLKSYFPYRIIYASIDKDTKQFNASAVLNMRIPNKLSRDGHIVFILNKGE